MVYRALLAVSCVLCVATPAWTQGTVLLVRHSERADTVTGAAPSMNADPSLSDAGRQRAESLAVMLRDANVSTIFVTQYKRTKETAAPLAKALGITPVVIDANRTSDLVARLQAVKGTALVVGHSNTVPEVIKSLGVPTPVTIADSEYDDLFVVTPSGQMVRLNYR
jgi:phosphohistidine phosphatase SixA